jgi:4-amino-4-deoxy-L-arabinose transferase-like glycosyltransferase
MIERAGGQSAVAGNGPRPAARPWPFPAGRGHRDGCIGGLILVLLCLAVYLPGLRSIPPVDRDESRFAQASRQMLEGGLAGKPGAWVVPMVQNRPRLGKPPLIYWLQAAAVWTLTGGDPARDAIWMYRVPSLLAAITTVLLTWGLGRKMFDPRAAWLGAALLAVCPMVVWDAHQARADQLLLVTTTATMGALWRVWRGAHEPRGRIARAAVFWFLLALGIMSKGPVTPMIAGLTILMLRATDRSWCFVKTLRPLVGLLIVALVVGPWVWLVGHQVGWGMYWQTIYNETVARSMSPREGHWGPPGYHLLLMPLLFWPGSMLAGAAIARAWRRGLRVDAPSGSRLTRLMSLTIGRPADLFCLAWILPAWLVFELVGTKLPHYTMPLYPALALLSARAVLAAAAGAMPNLGRGLSRLGLYGWAAIGVAIAGVAPFALGWADSPKPTLALWAACLAGAIAAAAFLVRTIRNLRSRLFLRIQVSAIGLAVVASIILFGAVLPSNSFIWTSPRVVRALALFDPALTRPFAAAGYHEDSLVFLTRGRVQLIDASGVRDWLARNAAGLVIVPAEPGARTLPIRRFEGVSGFNYSSGRAVQLLLVDTHP